MSLVSNIESILFVASQPLSFAKIANALKCSESEVEDVVAVLKDKYDTADSGLRILISKDAVQMGTNPDNFNSVEKFIKSEASGELTKAQLESLTVIAYAGPLTRPELEQIRGVNCAVIIRNLLMRGLIAEKDSQEKIGAIYFLTPDALANLGITNVKELPDYDKFTNHENIEFALDKNNDET
jgi:segregation and condensation protein B